MAWHYGTRSCGHEGRVQIYGPTKHREWKAQWWFSRPCEECLEQQRQEENAQNAEKAREMDLPELKGASEKQIAYAETCRMRLVAVLEQFIEEEEEWLSEVPEDQRAQRFKRRNYFPLEEMAAVIDHVLQKRSSRFWIENQYYTVTDVHLLLKRIYEELLIERRAAELRRDKEQKKAQEPKPEPLPPLRPEAPKTETIAEIRIAGDTLRIRFPEFREDFRKVVKEKLRMSWENGYWERKIGYRNGRIQDRAAEAAHRLLAAGFVVRIDDPESREKAVSGSYEPEHTRWIVTFSEGNNAGKFGIIWDRLIEDYYSVARKIPGSAWSNPYVIVRPEHFEEVLDFAERYGFRITAAAQDLMKAAREAKDRALMVKVAPPEEGGKTVVDTKPPKLEVPDEVKIDEELRDTD